MNEQADHALSIWNREGANFPAHCITCKGCQARLRSVKSLGRRKDKVASELLEAYHIKEKSEDCISDTSVTLYNAEKNFLADIVHL